MQNPQRTGWRIAARRVRLAACVLAIVGFGGQPPSSGQGSAAGQSRRGSAPQVREMRDTMPTDVASTLWIEIRNVTMHLDERATLRVRSLRGRMLSAEPGGPAVLDDRDSFAIQVTSGSVGLTGEDLSTLLNRFVFAYRGSPLDKLRARPAGEHVSLTGTMHKGVDLPFEITSEMTLTARGLIRLHPVEVRILGINGLALMRAIGLHLDDLLDLEGSRGARVEGNDIYLDPARILPPPAIAGRLASVGVEGDEVVIAFERTPADSVFDAWVQPDSSVANFVYFRGARLRFGKLLMTDTDLQIVDADPADPFDLNLEDYARQLIAGTSQTLPNLGLRVAMPDYDSLLAADR